MMKLIVKATQNKKKIKMITLIKNCKARMINKIAKKKMMMMIMLMILKPLKVI